MKKAAVSEIEPLVEEKKGNIAAIARALGVSRGTIHNRINESPTLAKALEDARETMIDNAESMLYKRMMDGDITALIFFLKTQAYHRGYGDKSKLELSGNNGNAIEIRVVYADKRTDGNAA